MKGSVISRSTAVAVLILVLGLTVYRASIQPIAHDEALAWRQYIDGSVYHLLAFDTNNHVLFAVPAKLFTKLFGLREITLRLPSALGALVYLTVVYLLARRLFGDGILLPLSVALLSLNPLILDFMAAARGYILGLACLIVAMYATARTIEDGPFDPQDRQWRWGCSVISVSLALSVVANLSNVFPAAGLTLAFVVAALLKSRNFQLVDARNLKSFVRLMVVPGAVVGLAIMWPYLIQLRPVQFNISLSSGPDALRDTFASSFLYKWTDDVYSSSLGAVATTLGSWQDTTLALGIYFFLPLLFCFLLLGLTLAYQWRHTIRERSLAYCRIFAGAPVACVLLTLILHVVLKVNYPFSRYCLYMIPLATVGTLVVARMVAQYVPSRALRVLGLLIGAAVVTDYSFSLNTRYFRYNAYDVISRDLFQTIASDAESKRMKSVRVGGTWWYEPEINFYRQRYHAEWMMPCDVKDPSSSWQTPNAFAASDYDYFVYTSANDPLLTGPRVTVIYHSAQMGVSVLRNLK
jgi:uncharacterized membrane protein